MHLKATTLESKLTAMQTEAEKERQNLQAKIDSMAEEINGYQALVRDIENESSETESSSAVAVRPDGNGQGGTVVLDLLQKASDVVDYEPLKGLDLAISRTHRERREASSSGQLVTMTTESVTQISVLRNQNRDLRRQLEEERSIGSSSSLLRDDELQRRFENLCDENIKLIDENAALTKSLERVENSLYARETRALDDQREQEANELEIDRLIDANHCLQTKSDALSRINEGYKASIADLQEEVDALKSQRDNNSNTTSNRCHDQTDGDALEEVALLQTENASLRKTNSMLERALNRLTSRAALHQDKLQELTMAQASLEREKEEFDVVVSKIRPRDDFGTSPDAAEEKNICLVENQTKTVTNEEKRDGSINSGERE